MKRPLLLFLAFSLFCLVSARAQFGSFGDVPIEINAEETRFEKGIAVAEENVIIRYGTTTIYCDFAQYNPDTRDVLVSGNVRIYREGRVFTGERAVYNLETKALTAADFRGAFPPFNFAGETFTTLGANGYQVRDGVFTTSDNSKPDYYLRAKSVRIYPNDRVIFTNVKLYIGRTPVFWFPYIYQSLNQEQSFSLSPGYSSIFGAYLLTRYTFPISDNWSGTLRLDLLSKRGVAIGFDSDWSSGTSKQNWGRFRSYYLHDAQPGLERTRFQPIREGLDPNRYRVSLQDRTYLTENIYSSIDINKLSDTRFLQDFEPGEFRRNPNPDNMIALTKWDEDYTVTLLGRKSLNDFFDFTERLPELSLDIKRQPVFGKSGLFYEGESSAGYLSRTFANNARLEEFDTVRVDTFHQLLYPQTYLGWLSIVPRVGLRATYYSDTGSYEDRLTQSTTSESTLTSEDAFTDNRFERRLSNGGSTVRVVANAGVEASFKLSRAYEQVQSRKLGLDGLRHIVQPFMNFSYVYSSEDSSDLLQIDRITPTTQQPPLDFPQFNAIDSIDNWTVLRLGVRNRFQTRRDNITFNWLEWNSFIDINVDRPDFPETLVGSEVRRTGNLSENRPVLADPLTDQGTFSNLHNRLRWIPLPWAALTIDSQFPLLDTGFTEVNTAVNFFVNRDVQLNVGHRFISGNPLFLDSNLLSFGGYLRVGDNWGFSFREQYELEDSVLESQRYELHRDLSSWIASLGFLVRDNRGVSDVGLILTFTLKDLPNIKLPLSFDPDQTTGSGSGRNR